jgi:hypothetical protein
MRAGAIEVARRILRVKIAPAMERPVEPRLDQHRLAIERDMAAADAILVHEDSAWTKTGC